MILIPFIGVSSIEGHRRLYAVYEGIVFIVHYNRV